MLVTEPPNDAILWVVIVYFEVLSTLISFRSSCTACFGATHAGIYPEEQWYHLSRYAVTSSWSGLVGFVQRYVTQPKDHRTSSWFQQFLDFGISKISKSEAKLLPNKTSAIPGDEENYIVSLSVFHQLHCLVGVVTYSSTNWEAYR